MEIKIDLNRNTTISLSKQIYQSIADRISSGLLEKGSRLPSVRSLSKSLNVSMVTVSKAYSMLADDHIISTIQGKGTYVQTEKITNHKVHESDLISLNWQLSIPDRLPRAQFWWQNINLKTKSQLWLSAASVHSSLLPEHLVSRHISSSILKNPGILSQYGPVQGDLNLCLMNIEIVLNTSVLLPYLTNPVSYICTDTFYIALSQFTTMHDKP